MGDFVRLCGSDLRCTYALSGQNMVFQPIYICNTCQGGTWAENSCCCGGCAEMCHEGHDVSFLAFGRGYCDCGMNRCSLVTSTVSDVPLNLIAQDELGRIMGTSEIGIKFDDFNEFTFIDDGDDKAQQSLYNLTQLHDACIELVKHSKDTFWIGSADTPSNIFEEFAMTVFRQHVHGASSSSFNPICSGAEWWIQVKRANSSASSEPHAVAEGDRIKTLSSGVDLHFDKDEEIAEKYGVGIFPQISTVTYLSSSRNHSPTLIVVDRVSDEIGSPLKKAFLSRPEFGKHISFDGRYLHGAPSMLTPESDPSVAGALVTYPTDELRVTFLVNIWLNHRPGISSVPSTLISSLPRASQPPKLHLAAAKPFRVKVSPNDVNEESGRGIWLKIPFVSDKAAWGKAEDEVGVYLKIWLPKQLLSYHGGPSSYEITYTKPVCCASLEYETDEEFIDEMEESLVFR